MVEVTYDPDMSGMAALRHFRAGKYDSIVWGCKSADEAQQYNRHGTGNILCVAAPHPKDPNPKEAKRKRKARKKRKKELNE